MTSVHDFALPPGQMSYRASQTRYHGHSNVTVGSTITSQAPQLAAAENRDYHQMVQRKHRYKSSHLIIQAISGNLATGTSQRPAPDDPQLPRTAASPVWSSDHGTECTWPAV